MFYGTFSKNPVLVNIFNTELQTVKISCFKLFKLQYFVFQLF